MESELKWQTCFGTMPSRFSCSSGKGLNMTSVVHRNESRRAEGFCWRKIPMNDRLIFFGARPMSGTLRYNLFVG